MAGSLKKKPGMGKDVAPPAGYLPGKKKKRAAKKAVKVKAGY